MASGDLKRSCLDAQPTMYKGCLAIFENYFLEIIIDNVFRFVRNNIIESRNKGGLLQEVNT